MNRQTRDIAPGLYLVATPIGNARDITLRALDLLQGVDLLVAEDTRALRRLMEIHGLRPGERPILSYHEHNGAKMRPRILAALAEGKSVAYTSEAGTPVISDPGFDLMRTALEEGHACTTAPGAVAAIAALTVSGLPSDRFLFAGFLPSSASRRRAALKELAGVPATLIFYESPRRLPAMLRDAATVLGPHRSAVVCRELTKKFEERIADRLEALAARFEATAPKGEIVVLIDRGAPPVADDATLDEMLHRAMKTGSLRDAATEVARSLNLPRRKVYQRAMELKSGD